MTELDDKLVPKAEELIERFGKQVTISGEMGEVYDPSTRSVSGGSSFSYSVKMSPPDKYSIKYVDGDAVKSGDLYGLVSSQTVSQDVMLAQTVTFDGLSYEVVEVMPIYSGEQVAVYELRMRK